MTDTMFEDKTHANCSCHPCEPLGFGLLRSAAHSLEDSTVRHCETAEAQETVRMEVVGGETEGNGRSMVLDILSLKGSRAPARTILYYKLLASAVDHLWCTLDHVGMDPQTELHSMTQHV